MRKRTRTKNSIKYKKRYLIDNDGDKHAPYIVSVRYDGYEPDLDQKLIDLAGRNSGVETGSGYGMGERDLSFDFFTPQGVRTFVKKAEQRYSYKFDLEAIVQVPVIEFNEIDIDELE